MLSGTRILFPLLASLTASLLFTPVAILCAARCGLCDRPDEAGLKIHRGAVPVLGGCAVFLALLVGMMPPLREGGAPLGLAVIIGCALFLVVLGVADDLKDLPPALRFASHLLVGLALSFGGVRIGCFASGVLNVAATVAVTVALINALNLLDGMDGLAAGVASLASLGFAGLFLLQPNGDAALAAALAGALLGFLPYNFHPARIFLGDNGSTLVGFLLAVLAISASSAGPSAVPLFVSLAIVWVPAFDTGWAVFRRLKAGRSLFTGDRDHFYDKLARRGLSQREVAAVGYGLTLAGTMVGWGIYLLFP